MSAVPVPPPRRLLDAEVDGVPVRVPEGSTILDACRAEGIDTPTMCYADNLTPINASAWSRWRELARSSPRARARWRPG